MAGWPPLPAPEQLDPWWPRRSRRPERAVGGFAPLLGGHAGGEDGDAGAEGGAELAAGGGGVRGAGELLAQAVEEGRDLARWQALDEDGEPVAVAAGQGVALTEVRAEERGGGGEP